MSDVAENVLLEKFSSSGRTGRRNALPDVMDKKYVGTSVASLPGQLDQLCLQMPSELQLHCRDVIFVVETCMSSR